MLRAFPSLLGHRPGLWHPAGRTDAYHKNTNRQDHQRQSLRLGNDPQQMAKKATRTTKTTGGKCLWFSFHEEISGNRCFHPSQVHAAGLRARSKANRVWSGRGNKGIIDLQARRFLINNHHLSGPELCQMLNQVLNLVSTCPNKTLPVCPCHSNLLPFQDSN